MTTPLQKPTKDTKDTKDAEEKSIATEAAEAEAEAKTQNGAPSFTSYFRVEIGDLKYDQREGQIIGTPYISLSTGQHDLAVVIIDDPEDKIRADISEDDEVKVFVGLEGDREVEMMVGKIAKFGRKLPDGLLIHIMDFTSEGKSSVAEVVDAKTGEEEDDEESDEETKDSEDKEKDKKKDEVKKYSDINKKGEKRSDVTSAVAKKKKLKYEEKNKITTDKEGEVIAGESDVGAASREALKVGDEVVTEGDTVKRVSPDGDEDTGIVLDWVKNRTVFIGSPTITKRTDNQPKGSGGSWKVEGWNVDKKTTEGAVVVVPPKNDYKPETEVTLPSGTVKLGDPIFKDSLYAWGDATLGGKRLPSTQKASDRIAAVAKTLDELNREHSPNEKWQIISWYNESGGARHEVGDAVSFVPQDPEKIFKALDPTWEGGLALYPKRFVHIDRRQDDGLPKLRFDY